MRRMGNIDRLLAAPLFDEDTAAEFARRRARVIARHRSWRHNFPAVGLLLGTDEERAHALAGNYATEAREVVGVWLSLVDDDDVDADARDQRAAWVAGFWRAWRDDVLGSDDFRKLDGVDGNTGPRDSFMLVFDDLSSRFCAEAVAYARQGRPPQPEPSFWGRLTAPLRAVAGGIGGFFFPTVRR